MIATGINKLGHLPEYSVSFPAWRSTVTEYGLTPIAIISGSRGKTLVAKLLESILQQAGLVVAIRSSAGVDIDGHRRRGELGPWNAVQRGLVTGEIDIAVQEVDWAMAPMLAANPRVPILAITNVCSNRDDCVTNGEANLANLAMPALLTAVVRGGWLVLNGEDLAVAADLPNTEHNRFLVGLGLKSPLMVEHSRAGGQVAWLRDSELQIGLRDHPESLGSKNALPSALDGHANFQSFNALMAAAIAKLMGIERHQIVAGLKGFLSRPESIPGSSDYLHLGGFSVVLDVPAPSWFLRPILRALRDFRKGRLLTVIGSLAGVPENNLGEVGRLLGRLSAIILTGNPGGANDIRLAAILEGAARNSVPPVVFPFSSEIAAFRKAVSLARPLDSIYVVSDAPRILGKEINRVVERGGKHLDYDITLEGARA